MPELAVSSGIPRLGRSSNWHRCINSCIIFRVGVSGLSLLVLRPRWIIQPSPYLLYVHYV